MALDTAGLQHARAGVVGIRQRRAARRSGEDQERDEAPQNASRQYAACPGASATPTVLVEALSARDDLTSIELYHLHTTGPVPFVEGEQAGRFRSVSLFAGPQLRRPIAEGRADFVPIFLSDIPLLLRSGHAGDGTLALLAISAILQVGAAVIFVTQMWPRVAARAPRPQSS